MGEKEELKVRPIERWRNPVSLNLARLVVTGGGGQRVGGVHFCGRLACVCVRVCVARVRACARTLLATAVEICFPSLCTCERERFVRRVAPATNHNRGMYINNK